MLVTFMSTYRYWSSEPVVKRTWPYDAWAAGVTWLELLLGTPAVFAVPPRTAARLHHVLHLDDQAPVRLHATSSLFYQGFSMSVESFVSLQGLNMCISFRLERPLCPSACQQQDNIPFCVQCSIPTMQRPILI